MNQKNTIRARACGRNAGSRRARRRPASARTVVDLDRRQVEVAALAPVTVERRRGDHVDARATRRSAARVVRRPRHAGSSWRVGDVGQLGVDAAVPASLAASSARATAVLSAASSPRWATSSSSISACSSSAPSSASSRPLRRSFSMAISCMQRLGLARSDDGLQLTLEACPVQVDLVRVRFGSGDRRVELVELAPQRHRAGSSHSR